jgi:predicted RNase H-like HicB family nuclease/predicted DNA-binding protein (UPF0251 family)
VVALSEVFEVVCIRSGDWWAIEVPRVPGVHTQAKRLDQVPAMAKDAIALMLDVPEEEVEISIRHTQLSSSRDSLAEQELIALAQEPQELFERNTKFMARTRSVALQLVHDQGLTLRDAGALMGLSHQRVAQLLGSDKPKGAITAGRHT